MWPIPSTYQKRRKHLNAIADQFVGQSIASIHYFDCVCDEHGNAHFELDNHTDHHEIMLSVDLIFENSGVLGFYWDTYRDPGDYELHLSERSSSELLAKDGGSKRIAMHEHPQLLPFIGETITGYTFSKSLLAHPRDKCICDCRIDCANGRSFWICTRHIDGYRESADDLILVFDVDFARKIGIQINAR